MNTPADTPALPGPVPLHRRIGKRLRSLFALALSALWGPLLLLSMACALWVWSGSAGSLRTVLQVLAWSLPAGQQLSSADVQGNLREGGQLGLLRWQSQGLQVEARGAHIALDWSLLWRQPWPVRSIHLEALNIEDQRPPQPMTALSSLKLPLPVQMSLQIQQMTWKGATTLMLSHVQADYAYDGHEHSLHVNSLTLAKGQYTLQARLQAAAPMALNIGLQGQVQTPSTDRNAATQLALQSTVQGTLSGMQAELSVTAQLAPKLAPSLKESTSTRAQDAPHLDLQALIRPWQKQPVVQAQAQWQALDLAPLWPGAPQTRLNGQSNVKPEGDAWLLDAQLTNLTPGPWDQARLPVSQLRVRARHHLGLWQVQQLQAELASGQVQGQGQQTLLGWTGLLDVSGLVPAQMHSAMAGPPMQGRLQAQSVALDRIAIQADLTTQDLPGKGSFASKRPTTTAGRPSWERLHLQGQWQGDEWDIASLKIDAAQASLEAQFKLHPAKLSAQGRFAVTLPGLKAHGQGTLAPLNGQGTLDMDVQDAAQSLAWLQSWPGWGASLKPFKASGPGVLAARWEGGYAQADAPLTLQLQLPRVEWQRPQQSPWFITQTQLQLQGTPRSLQAQLQARIGQGAQSAELQTHWSANRGDMKSHDWQGQIDRLKLTSQNPKAPMPAAPGTEPTSSWLLELKQAWAWQAHLSDLEPHLSWGPTTWQVQGPTPGTAQLLGEAGAWTAPAPGRPARAQGAARWQDLPLSWLTVWANTDVQNDVMLQGQIQVQMDQDLSVTASVQRSRGDLLIHTENAAGQRWPAGLREARALLRIHNENIQTELSWDSEHLGQIQAQLQSRLAQTTEGWQWSEQAPLSGKVQARLPKVGAWSVLAPPGWRVQGTLDAQFDLSGTRTQPQWQGRLQADNLAVRSAVQGIEFSQGQLQARLQAQELILERLSLRGAGAQGGELQARGEISFAPTGRATPGSSTSPLSAARMTLQMEAKALRVSNRADRRLAISGDVTAQMDKGQLLVRGLVKADQALFILPDDSTPSLGSDVLVVRPSSGDIPTGDAALKGQAPASWLGVPDVRVMLDLGPDFLVQGQGLNTRLGGQVQLVSNAATRGQPRLTGQVRTEGGRYKAYGQQLTIETGVLRFNGPYDNPSLDIIALRPNLSQSVGVQVTGTALLPRIRLYAEPDMPDADKLAWLVLGRSAASGGAESAVLQQAALVLLGGNGKTLSGELASSLGLDEISLASGSRSDTTATGAAITLGKRLSKDFYLAYETSLSGTFGSLYIFYDLSQRLTLRAQAGQQSALDLIFTIRKD